MKKTLVRYEEIPLTLAELPSDPITLFELWFTQAKQQGEPEPSAMTLATVTHDYDISARMVLEVLVKIERDFLKIFLCTIP